MTLLKQLSNIHYVRRDGEFTPGAYRVRGDVVDVMPAYYEHEAYRIEFWGDEIERLTRFDPLTGETHDEESYLTVYPAKLFVTPKEQIEKSIDDIREELRWRVAILREEGKNLEAHRLEQRTNFDIEMMLEVGYCSGIENYSRHLSRREPGERPHCLMDYFPDDFLLIADESHVTVPQVRGMYNGDRARKLVLVEHGFRLPSALDNRPMKYEEWEDRHNQVIFTSATPGGLELEYCQGVVVEQVIRPTGIMDPEAEVRPLENQIDDLLSEINEVVARKERVLVTTLTKRMAEDLTEYLDTFGRPCQISPLGYRRARACRNPCVIFALAILTFWSESTCSARVLIFRRCHWSQSLMPIRKGSYGLTALSSRRRGALPETCGERSSCTPTGSPAQ